VRDLGFDSWQNPLKERRETIELGEALSKLFSIEPFVYCACHSLLIQLLPLVQSTAVIFSSAVYLKLKCCS